MKDILITAAQITFCFMALFVVYWVISRNYFHKQFEKNLKKGDPIKFYIGEEKHYGIVTHVGQIFINITYYEPELNCSISIGLQWTEIYPKFGYNYKK